MTWDVTFIDAGREPKEKPDPDFPNGRELDLRTNVLQKHCCRGVPYPAPRCGQYLITCNVCRLRVVVTVAGRPDDPRSITLPCKAKGMN
jgi:hypothetical protein